MKDFRKLSKILFINQSLSIGGAENFVLALFSWFVKNGVNVKAYTNSTSFIGKLKKSGIKTKRIPIVIDIIGDWKGFLKGVILFIPGVIYYAKLVFQNRNEGVVFLSGYIEKILVTPWTKLLNIPTVWVEHGPLAPILNKFFGIPKTLYRFVSKYPDYVIFPSHFSMESNIKISGIDKKKMLVVNDGIIPIKRYPGKIIPNTAYCASRLEEGKGQDILIKAWKKVIEVFPEAKLYIIGTGDFRIKLEKLIEELQLQKNVILTGWIKEIASKASFAELGVFPSVWDLEGFGVVLLEAMNMSKPTICFDHGPYSEVVDSKCAVIVKEKSPEALARAIVKVFSDKKLSDSLGKNGRIRFNKLFTINICGLEYGKVFEKAIMDRTLFKRSSRFSIYLYDLMNKGLTLFITERIKKRKLGRKLFYLFKKPYVNVLGKKLYINKMDTVVSESLLGKETWEPQMTKLLLKYLSKYRTFVDIGANIGYFSLIIGNTLIDKGKVFAFEPASNNFKFLEKTINEANLGNITIEKLALGDSESEGFIYLNDENFGDQRLWGEKTKKKEKIQITTLDRYFSNISTNPELVKIDVQGYELKVLKGAISLLKKKRIKVIVSELWPSGLKSAGDSWEKYVAYLRKYGFNLFEILDSGKTIPFSDRYIKEEYLEDNEFTTNILAILKR